MTKTSIGKQILESILQDLEINIHMEYKAIPNRKYRIDYAIPSKKLAIEFEGGIMIKGGTGHRSITNFCSDVEKYNLLAIYGWRLFRVTALTAKDPETLRKMITAFIYGNY